jgi:hypothetical protein
MPNPRIGLSADDLGQESFTCLVAMEHAILATLLEVDDKLKSNPGVTRPLWIRRGFTVTGQISGIVLGH